MVILPYASRDDVLDELAQITEARDRMGATRVVNQTRAQERRDTLARWERDLNAQLAEMDAGCGCGKPKPCACDRSGGRSLEATAGAVARSGGEPR